MTDKEKIAFQSKEIASLKEEIEDLKKKLYMALAKIEDLSIKKTSKNSSVPPSHDIAKTKSLRSKSDKNRGGQPGHKGSTLKMVAVPDVVEVLKPDYCSNCGQRIADQWFHFHAKRQVIDIPLISPVVTEYQQYQARCSCGSSSVTDFPTGVNTHVQYGNNIEALVGYLSVNQYVPYQRVVHFLANVCGLQISEGTVNNMLERLSEKAIPFYERIRDKLKNSKQAVGADETSCSVNGEHYWAWVWQDQQYTYLTVSDNRGKKTVETHFPGGFPQACLSSDRWASHLNTKAKVHQICLAHLLRELNYLEALEKHYFSIELQNLFRKAIQEKTTHQVFTFGDEKSQELEQTLDRLLITNIDQALCPKTATLQKSLIKLRDSVFVFLYDKELSADNNASERAIRNFKVKTKVSGMFKSGQIAYARLKSLSETVKKRGQNTFELFINLANSNYTISTFTPAE